ncbi:MAG: sigma-54-dependent Fis family transcriptional regulator [Chlamydiae bacterium]|nr:MAG: sigma-54-dependent Fis family transcriptional regulator [Chlamydiota bacterium]
MKNNKLIKSIAKAAYINPFSEERIDIDKEISGDDKNHTHDYLIKKVVEITKQTIPKLKKINNYAEEEKQDVVYLYLFDIYHKYREEFDTLIVKQISAGDDSLKVFFAQSVISDLINYGFSEVEAVRYFSIFYQMRRAFYFIFNTLSGVSDCMRKFHCSLWDNIFTHDIRWYEKILCAKMEDFSTLLLGETGTGKGTAAAAIGRSGFIPFNTRTGKFEESFAKTFIEINLSQFPETLIESELFGHKRGAFTGAIEAHNGLFSLSSTYGSVFLDEIGDVSIPIQIKLLRVLQDRTFSPVGSHKKLRFDGRVIAATNKPINKLRREEIFRDDFFYRLCSDIITVPSLRQRISENSSELPLLLKKTINKITGENSMEIYDMIYETVINSLGKNYPWPGNVRELEQCVRRILLTNQYKGDKKTVSKNLQNKIATDITAENYDAQNLIADYCKLLYQRYGTYQDVAQITKLDRRTVKKYMMMD